MSMKVEREARGAVVTVMLVTKEIADKWLNENPCNRDLRPGIVEKYASDLRAGRWTQCNVAIAWYADGELADGQHRLYAISETGISMMCIVMRGLPRSAGLNIDTGLTRTLVDNAKISGSDPDLSHMLISVARAIEFGRRGDQALSNSARLEFIQKHREAATWAIANGPSGRMVRNAVTLAAVGRAWYVEKDHLEKLARYGQVLGGAFTEGRSESAAVAMRNYIVGKAGIAISPPMWVDTFWKVQNTISYFMRGTPLTVVKGVSVEMYPLGRTKTRSDRKNA